MFHSAITVVLNVQLTRLT